MFIRIFNITYESKIIDPSFVGTIAGKKRVKGNKIYM